MILVSSSPVRHEQAAPFFGRQQVKKPVVPLLEPSIESPASKQFEARVNAGLASLPALVQRALFADYWRVTIGKFLTDALPHLKGKVPRGWPEWTTWDNSDAVCSSSRKRVGIAEYAYAWNSTNELVKTRQMASTLRHEVGHAVDVSMFNRLSGAPAFLMAYSADFAALNESQKKEFDYYIQPNPEGKPTLSGYREACAEAFASLYGGGCSYVSSFQKAFPSTVKAVKKALAEYEEMLAEKKNKFRQGEPVVAQRTSPFNIAAMTQLALHDIRAEKQGEEKAAG